MTLSRGVGEDFQTFEKKKKRRGGSDEALHCLSDAGGFLTALRFLSPTLRDRETKLTKKN